MIIYTKSKIHDFNLSTLFVTLCPNQSHCHLDNIYLHYWHQNYCRNLKENHALYSMYQQYGLTFYIVCTLFLCNLKWMVIFLYHGIYLHQWQWEVSWIIRSDIFHHSFSYCKTNEYTRLRLGKGSISITWVCTIEIWPLRHVKNLITWFSNINSLALCIVKHRHW